jgi:hypothetical protein
MDIDETGIRSILSKANTVPNSVTLLKNSDGILISSSNNLKKDTELYQSLLPPDKALNDCNVVTEINNHYIISQHLASSNWDMVTIIPFHDFISESKCLDKNYCIYLWQ